MAEPILRGRHIMVVEDEYLLAEQLRLELEGVGAVVVGPAGNLEHAIDLISAKGSLHGAILDVNLADEVAYPLADLLVERGVPFVFTTGYDPVAIPARFRQVARYDKPVNPAGIINAMDQAIRDCR